MPYLVANTESGETKILSTMIAETKEFFTS